LISQASHPTAVGSWFAMRPQSQAWRYSNKRV